MINVELNKPIEEIIPFFNAIKERDWDKFCALEEEFCQRYGVESWQHEFNFCIKPALDKESDRWLLIQWCGGGVVESEVVG